MLQKKQRVYLQVFQKLKNARHIALVSHRNPDIDTIGSAIAFYDLLKNLPGIRQVDLICKDPLPKKYLFLPHTHLYSQEFDPYDYDCILFFDSGSKSQTGWDEMYPNLFDGLSFPTISIDHHGTNERYARQNILNTSYSSTTMIVFEMFVLCKARISPNIATSLLAGLYTDTGGLKHSNTSQISYLFAGQLLRYGAKLQEITTNLFLSHSLATLRLWGMILSESFIDQEDVLYSYVNASMLKATHTTYDDIAGINDYLNMSQNISYSVLYTQKGEYVRASLRTLRDDIDLSAIAKKHDGGGHKKASGFTIKTTLQESRNLNIDL